MYGELVLSSLEKAIKRFSEKEKVDRTSKQFAIYTDNENFDVLFYNLTDFQIKEKVTFKQVMNIGKVDWLSTEALSKPYMSNTLKRLCTKHNVNFDKGQNVPYQMKKESNGLYAFILKGSFVIDEQEMGLRDGLGITGTNQIDITAREDDAEILLMEVPMNLD